jgi:hypothetical protein
MLQVVFRSIVVLIFRGAIRLNTTQSTRLFRLLFTAWNVVHVAFLPTLEQNNCLLPALNERTSTFNHGVAERGEVSLDRRPRSRL